MLVILLYLGLGLVAFYTIGHHLSTKSFSSLHVERSETPKPVSSWLYSLSHYPSPPSSSSYPTAFPSILSAVFYFLSSILVFKMNNTKVSMYYKSTPDNEDLIAACPSLQVYKPSFGPFSNGHYQTLLGNMGRARHDLVEVDERFVLTDGGEILLHWYPADPSTAKDGISDASKRFLVFKYFKLHLLNPLHDRKRGDCHNNTRLVW